jgi:zinc and cadmium transporter
MHLDLLTLTQIAGATLLAGVGSVWLAKLLLTARLVAGGVASNRQNLLSLAAGTLLATALLHLLPEAFQSDNRPEVLFALLLAGLLIFFLLDKAELWHHGHEHVASTEQTSRRSELKEENLPTDAGGRSARAHHKSGGVWSALLGDGLHCFSDGLVIASALMVDARLGAVASAAVLVHEIPHHIGDLILVRQAVGTAQGAFLKVAIAGLMTTVGGICGFALVSQLSAWTPYFLVFSGSSFVYVALADLIPQLQTHLRARETACQVAFLVAGIAVVGVVSRIAEPSRDTTSALASPAVGAQQHRTRKRHIFHALVRKSISNNSVSANGSSPWIALAECQFSRS